MIYRPNWRSFLILFVGCVIIVVGFSSCGTSTAANDDVSSKHAVPLELIVPPCDEVDEPIPFPEQDFNCASNTSDPAWARK